MMNQLNMFDGKESKKRRDEKLVQVTENAGPLFQNQVLQVCKQYAGKQVTGEDIRRICAEHNVQPHHHNAWGGVIGGLIRRKVLVPTGRYTSMKAKTSHARKTQIYLISG